MQGSIVTAPAVRLRRWLVACVVCGLGLVALGGLLVPTTNPLSLLAAAVVLVLYGVTAWLGLPRLAGRDAALLPLIIVFGLLAAAIFAGEVLLEYALLPADNTLFGYVEFGGVFCVYGLAAGFYGYKRQRLRRAVLVSVATAMISSLLWLLVVVVVFYLFRGTARQAQVFRAEGNYADFAASRMRDFDAFIMEDFMGAAFYHLLLGPAIAALLGLLGGGLGKGVAMLRAR